jgi:hypothetical protein
MPPAEPLQPEPLQFRAIIGPTLAALGATALLSLSGAPAEKTLVRLQALGVGEGDGRLLLHLAPLLVVGIAVPMGMALSRGRSQAARLVLQGGLGAIVGFLTAFCLDLFIGFGAVLETFFGPQNPAHWVDVIAWMVVAFSVIFGVLGALSPLQGGGRANAMGHDRAVMIWAGFGLIGHGMLVGALAVLHQSEAPSTLARLQALGLFGLGVLMFAWSSIVLWRRYDELYRLVVVRAYAWTGGIASTFVVAWAALELAGFAPTLSLYAVSILLLALQFVVTISISVKLTASHLN